MEKIKILIQNTLQPVADFLQIRPDFFAHAVVCFMSTFAIYWLLKLWGRQKENLMLTAAGLVTWLGFGAEWYFQMVGQVRPEWNDIIGNTVGVGFACMLIWIINMRKR